MEEVVDDLSVRALGSDLLLVRSVHVHHHGFQPTAALGSEEFEEGTHVFSPPPRPHPQDLLADGVEDGGGVAMALPKSELIDPDHFHLGEIDGQEASGEGRLIQGFHGVPAEAVPLSDVLHGGNSAQPGHALGESSGDPRPTREPGQLFHLGPATGTGYPIAREPHEGVGIEDRQIAHAAQRHLMGFLPLLPAPRAAEKPLSPNELDVNLRTSLGPAALHPSYRLHRVPFPATENLATVERRQGAPPSLKERVSDGLTFPRIGVRCLAFNSSDPGFPG